MSDREELKNYLEGKGYEPNILSPSNDEPNPYILNYKEELEEVEEEEEKFSECGCSNYCNKCLGISWKDFLWIDF